MKIQEKDLSSLAYIQREQNFVHHTYDDERYLFDLIRQGDETVIELDSKKFRGEHNGHLSNDPLRDKKYLFVVETTLAARAAIEGGLHEQIAYNLGDLYVQLADRCDSVAQVEVLHRDMVADYTHRVLNLKKQKIYSKPILQCIDYIHWNLHRRITIKELAEHVNLHPSYLSVLFKEKVGMSASEYIRREKIETAKDMLKYTDLDFSQIANTLAFSSQSHFTRLIREATGMTPREYRNYYYKNGESLLPPVSVNSDLYGTSSVVSRY